MDVVAPAIAVAYLCIEQGVEGRKVDHHPSTPSRSKQPTSTQLVQPVRGRFSTLMYNDSEEWNTCSLLASSSWTSECVADFYIIVAL